MPNVPCNVLVFPNLAAAATAHTAPDGAAQFLVTAFNSRVAALTPARLSLGAIAVLPQYS